LKVIAEQQQERERFFRSRETLLRTIVPQDRAQHLSGLWPSHKSLIAGSTVERVNKVIDRNKSMVPAYASRRAIRADRNGQPVLPKLRDDLLVQRRMGPLDTIPHRFGIVPKIRRRQMPEKVWQATGQC
jgi:hypothetical protein